MAEPRTVDHTGVLVHRVGRLARTAAWSCACFAWLALAVGLAGHVAGMPTLTSFVPDMPGITVATAVVLALVGVALWYAASLARRGTAVSIVVATCAAALAAGALALDGSGTDLGLRQLLGDSPVSGSETMSPQGAIAVLLLCGALLVTRRWPLVAQAFAAGAALIAAAVVIAVAVGAGTFLGMPGVPQSSLPAALALGALALGTIALRTDVGVGRVIAASTRGGRLARRGLVFAVVMSLGLAAVLIVLRERFGLVSSDAATLLYALGSLAVALGLVLRLSFWIDRVDRARAVAIQELVASEARARELIEHAPEAIVVLDVDRGHFVRVNQEAEHLLGLPAHELMRRGPLDVSAPVQADGRPAEVELQEQMRRALAGEVPVFEWVLRTLKGRPIDVEVRLLRLPDRGRTLVRGSIVEVAERKRAEEALRAVASERAARAAAETDRDRIATLQRITARLLAAPSVDDVGAAFVQQVVPDLGASTGLIYTLSDGRLLRRGSTPDVRDPDWDSIELDAATTSATAARSREPVIVTSVGDAEQTFPMLAGAMPALGYVAFASFPLFSGDQLVGVASFGFHEAPPDDHWHFLGRVADRVGQALERARLFETERQTRRQLEQAAERAAAMQRVTQALARAVTVDEVVDLTATLGIEALGADASTAGLLDPDRDEFAVRTYGFPREQGPWHSRIGTDRALPGPATVRTQRPLWFSTAPDMVEAFPETHGFLEESGFRATACVPLVAWGRAVGFLAAHYAEDRVFTEVDRVVFTTLGSVSAQALERAQRFESERETASVLQQSMLPAQLPDLPNVSISARYSSAGELEVGGDWYDAIALDDGSVVVTVGDVVGRGLAAAAAMGQLRSAIHALALATTQPSDVLATLDRYATAVDGARLATVAIARLIPTTESLVYASAGHVPAVLVLPDGTTRLLEPSGSLPLDAMPDPERDELRVDFPTGSTLVLYSDGLIERRGESLDVGLQRLVRTAGALHRADVESMCEHIVAALLPRSEQRDDVAVLCVRLEASSAALRRRFPASPSELAPLREELRAWLANAGLSPQRAADLVLAVDEACANAVEHAYDGTPGGEVVVEVARRPDDEVVARVHDAGRWRNQEQNPTRGRGLGIIRAVVDECEIQTGATGTTVLLKQRIRRR
ncbi:MAG TPA: SpoIIE family protein phosphatase [Acidimicrobiia bacterium]|jgi:PAS domain S-box-containing protein